MDDDTTDHFYETGTVHLLSISGLHVGLLALALFWGMQLGMWRRGLALAAVAAITTAYAVLIDAEPPALRATLMVWCVCLALGLGRPLSRFNVLAAAALVVLAINPAELFRVGAQLSFMAVGVIFWIAPRLPRSGPLDPLERLIATARPLPMRLAARWWRGAGQMLLITSTIWIVSAPLVLAQFHLISPAGLILTPLLAAPIAVGLFSGFIVVALGWLLWPLSLLLGRVCDACLGLVTAVVDFAAGVPGSHFWMPGPPTWWLIGFYGLLGAWALDARLLPRRRWCVALLAAWSAAGLLSSRSLHAGNDELVCTFLSVGHGSAVAVELPDGRLLLYDAGSLGAPSTAVRAVSDFLWSRGRRHIDAVVISHADSDHFNALPALLERFSVGVVYVSPVMFGEERDTGTSAATSAALTALRRAIEEAGAPVREVFAGDRLGAADCTIDVLHPPSRGTLGSDNSNSIVMAICYRGVRILLPGDLESPGLDELTAESPLDCDVVLAPHHGSAGSDPPGFATWATPEWVVVSGDRRSMRPAVTAAYTAAGAEVVNTAARGAVAVTVSPLGLGVHPWRDVPLPADVEE